MKKTLKEVFVLKEENNNLIDIPDYVYLVIKHFLIL